MSGNTKDSIIQPSGFIETKFGPIYKDDIPYVINEPFSHRFGKSMLFYSVFIIAFVLILYITYMQDYHKKTIKSIHERQLLQSNNIQKIPSSVEAQTIYIYNSTNQIPLDHIVLIDIYNNVIDVDIKYNYFAKHKKIGNSGDLYSIDFGSAQEIKEITLIMDPDKLFYLHDKNAGYTIDIYNSNKKVWTHSDMINNSKEVTIPIYKDIYLFKPTEYEKLNSTGIAKDILLFNENLLALKLRENGEDGYYNY